MHFSLHLSLAVIYAVSSLVQRLLNLLYCKLEVLV